MTRLEDVCAYRNEIVDIKELNGPIAYISTDSMSPNRGPIANSSLPSSGKVKRFHPGDTLISNIRPYFKKIWIADAEGTCSNDILVFQPKTCTSSYLHWSLSNDRFFTYVTKTAKGTKMPRGDKRAIMEYELRVPSQDEQDAICSVLNSLQSKIALNNQINGYLDELQEVTYRQFLKEAGSLHREGTLSELVEVRYGKDHKKLGDGEVPVYGSGGLMRYAESALFKGESVLIPRKGTLNNVMYVNEAFWTVDTMFYTIPKAQGAAKYAYQFLKRLDLASMNSGSAVPSMTTKILNALRLPVPTASDLMALDIKLEPMFEAQRIRNYESKCLNNLRDALLPKLMSGEIDVSKIDLTQLNSHLSGY